jgi:hypothetical protein
MKKAIQREWPKQQPAFRNNYLAAITVTVLAFFFTLQSYGQGLDTNRNVLPVNAFGYKYKNIHIDSSLRIPRDTFKLKRADSGSLAILSNVIYQWNGIYWVATTSSGGSSSETASNAIRKTTGNYKWGGDLIENTTVNGKGLYNSIFDSVTQFHAKTYPSTFQIYMNGSAGYMFSGLGAFHGLYIQSDVVQTDRFVNVNEYGQVRIDAYGVRLYTSDSIYLSSNVGATLSGVQNIVMSGYRSSGDSVLTVGLDKRLKNISTGNFGAHTNVGSGAQVLLPSAKQIKTFTSGLYTDWNSTSTELSVDIDTAAMPKTVFVDSSGIGIRYGASIAGVPDTLVFWSTGGGGSSSLTDTRVGYGDASNLLTGSANFTWNQTAKRLSIFSTSTADLLGYNDASLKIIGNRLYLGDSTSDEPTYIEFGNPYGEATGSPMRFTTGWMGGEEFNYFGWNFHYRGQNHEKYDYTKHALWGAITSDYLLVQLQGIGYDWNDNAGSKVGYRFDFIKSSNAYLGAKLSINQIDIVDHTTSTYQNNDGRKAEFRVANATLGIGGLQEINIPDTTQLFLGNIGTNTAPLLGIQATGKSTQADFWNIDANTNHIIFDVRKNQAGDWDAMASGDNLFEMKFNTLGSLKTVFNGDAAAGFRAFDYVFTGSDASLTTAERMRLTGRGSLLIGTATELASSLLTVTSTTQGVLFPRLTTTQQNAISSPADGLTIYNTDSSDIFVYKSSAWARAGAAGGGGGGSESTTASNGLTLSGVDVKLGGPLTANTSLNLSTFYLDINTGGTTVLKTFSNGEVVLPGTLAIGQSSVTDGTNQLEIKKTGANTQFALYNIDNNDNRNLFRFLKNRAGSYNLTDGDIIGDFDFNTLGQIRAVAAGTATGGFKPFEFQFRTTDNAGSTATRVTISNTGAALYGADYSAQMSTDRYIPDIGKVNSLITADVMPYATYALVTDKTFSGTSAEVVTFDTELNEVGITHSTGTNPEEITFATSGVYTISFDAHVFSTSTDNIKFSIQMWDGDSWEFMSNSAALGKVSVANNTNSVTLSYQSYFSASSKIRIVAAATTTNCTLNAIAADANGSEVPAARIVIKGHKAVAP